jgi:DNA-binding HxlR family transcriptional regulator/putative sterol carrier protein
VATSGTSSKCYTFTVAVSSASRRRSYDQYCAVARGLDVIGERWTLLIIRDLLLGPKRYKDLLDGLPGIGTNLLADRLHQMERLGLIERTVLPPPAGSTVYRLTEAGEALEPALMAIGRWGARFLGGGPKKTDTMVPRAYFVAIRAAFRPELAEGLRETYEFRIGKLGVFEVRVEGPRCFTAERQASRPDAVFTMNVETLNGLLFQLLSPAEALATGSVQVEGDAAALQRFVKIFALRGHSEVAGLIAPKGKAAANRRA